MGAFVLYSGMLKRIAVKLSKIANDLRLLSSGPRGGFAEIALPPMQPGSSIMPGKVNPVIPEVVNQVRSEEHTSELQSLMRISYAVFCLKKKKTTHNQTNNINKTKEQII